MGYTTGFRWGEAQDAILRDEWNKGTYSHKIAELIGGGISNKAVIGRASRLGLARHKRAYYGPPGGHKKSRPQVTRLVPVPKVYAPIECFSIPFMDWEPHHCRYPVTDDAPFLVCGHTKLEGSSYCGYHDAICHQSKQVLCEAA